jgi:hypothetical protein
LCPNQIAKTLEEIIVKYVGYNIIINSASVKNVHAMQKSHMIQNYDNNILKGLAVADPVNPTSIVS